MPSMTVRNDQKAYLERMARALASQRGEHVSPTDALQLILDMCIRDEGVYEPRSTQPVRPDSREIYVSERSTRQAFSLEELLLRIGSGG